MTNVTNLKDVLDSNRAVNALRKSGVETVDDLSKKTMEELAAVKGVGQRTLEQIQSFRAVGAGDTMANFGEVEESAADIHLLSPRQKYVIWVLRGDRIHDQLSGSNRVVPPILIEFDKGRGTISRNKYLNRRYFRDAEKIRTHIEEGKPWRVECADWLKGRQKHGIEYTLMTD